MVFAGTNDGHDTILRVKRGSDERERERGRE